MFIDSRTLPEDSVIEADICIIGAGAAGITMAKEFSNSRLRVCVLESGDYEYDSETQGLYVGDDVGIPYFPLVACRLRFFGGTTNHWSGSCRPFSEEDFMARDWVPNSGWPITRQDLVPYYMRASEILKLDTSGWDLEYWKDHDNHPQMKFEDDDLETRVVLKAQEPFMRLGRYYRDEVKQAENVIVYLNANVTDIASDDQAQEVSHLKVECLSGNKFSVKAKKYVLATGGIENPRLLLLSNNTIASGLGNQNDLVGRYFMEHPRFLAGKILPSDADMDAGFYDWHNVLNSIIKGYLTFPKDVLKKEKMVDIQIRLETHTIESYVDAANADGVNSFNELAGSISKFELPDELGKHIGNVISDIDDIAVTTYRKIRYGGMPVEIHLYPRICQVPNPDSRVMLSNDLDQLGQRKSKLDWQLTSTDKHSVKKAMQLLGIDLGKAGLGRLQNMTDDMDVWPSDVTGGWHHMGTTRMSHSEKSGVVDKNCQVFGVSNLYIAGSSVFPTAGSGTPTLTIMALAIRLADHIKREVA